MFNVGIVASGRSAPRVKLTDRELVIGYTSGDATYRYRAVFDPSGVLQVQAGEVLAPVAGEWKLSGATSDYEIRISQQAGNLPTASPPVGTWGGLSSPTRFLQWSSQLGVPTGGRILVEIRDNATQTIQASARFWTQGYAP